MPTVTIVCAVCHQPIDGHTWRPGVGLVCDAHAETPDENGGA